MTGADLLLAQDGDADRELTLRALRQEAPEVRVAVARDGAEALDFLLVTGEHAARAALPPPAAALIDLRLARVDGFAVLERLRAERRTALLPVVVLSASTDAGDRERAYRLGANSYVETGLDYAAFAGAIGMVARYWTGVNRPAR